MALKVMVVDEELGILRLFKALVELMGFEAHHGGRRIGSRAAE